MSILDAMVVQGIALVVGYYRIQFWLLLGRLLADSILAATAATAMVKWSWDRAVGRNRPQIYVVLYQKLHTGGNCGVNGILKLCLWYPPHLRIHT